MGTSSQSFSSEFQFEYQEEMLISVSASQKMTIGVPKENPDKERRVPLTPNTVKFLVDNGVKVLLETNAGLASNFTDKEFSEAGADIIEQTEAVYNADIIIKIAPPDKKEIALLKKNQVLISTLNLKTLDRVFFEELSKKKITAIALEYIKDTNGSYPFIEFMSEIIGRVAINIISNFLMEKKGKLIGGIPGNKPSELIIIGAGAVAHSLVHSAISQKASVKVFDNSVSRLRTLEQSVSSNIYSSIINMPQLLKEFSRADVVIGALPNYEEYNNFIIPKEYVKQMKKDSLIIDLSIDQGICFETSRLTDFKNPTFEKYGVTHYGIPNISSIASRTSSKVLGNIYLQYFSSFQNYGNFNHFLKNDSNFRNGLYFYNGILVKEHIGKLFDIPSKDIDLILAAF